MRTRSLFLFLVCNILIFLNGQSQVKVDPLASNNPGTGEALLPVPQKVSFTGQNFLFNDSWTIEVPANIPENDPAVLSLMSELKARYGLKIKAKKTTKVSNSPRTIRLTVKEGSVPIGEATTRTRLHFRNRHTG